VLLRIGADMIKSLEWDNSYKNKDNFLFYPHEEIVRFINRFVIKRVGVDDFHPILKDRVLLDLGCGIGRHVFYGLENKIDSYGVDLSEEAISIAKDISCIKNISNIENRFIVSDIRKMPWESNTFNIVVSHGVLDSMPFDVAVDGVKELHRVTSTNALLYSDLICSSDQNKDLEVIVRAKHENNTIQSFFTRKKIDKLFANFFSIIEIVVIDRENLITGCVDSRYHLILRRV